MKKIRMILILFFLLLLIFSVYRFASEILDYREGRESYAALTQYISFGSPTEAAVSPAPTAVPAAESTDSRIQPDTAAAAQNTAKPTNPIVSDEPEESPAGQTSASPEASPVRMDAPTTIPSDSIAPESSRPVQQNPAAVQESAAPEASPEPTEPPVIWPEVDFDHLRSINPDVVGWIYIEGTHINYPIVQAKDNKHYLKRMFDGKRNPAGCIFLDYRCEADFSGLHSILYGHHMKDDSMFADLVLYKEQSFYDSHPVALLITPTHKYKIALFSSYVAGNHDDSWQLDFGQQEFESWLRSKIKRSSFEAVSLPDGDENILTLSTCTYDYDGAKYILHGFVSEIMENAPEPR